MCLDVKTSLLTFIIGTALNTWNITYYKNNTIIAVSILWQWVLSMQLFEAYAWYNQKSPLQMQWAAKGAYLANITQPIVFAIVMFVLKSDELSLQTKITAGGVLTGYILWLLYASNKIPEVKQLIPTNDCNNLTYTWWNQFPGNAYIYIITLVCLILLMLKPFNFALMQLSYILLALILSMIYYSCGSPGSMWCLLAAFAPLLVGPMWESSF